MTTEHLQHVLSPLSMDEINALGHLPSEAIAGQYLDPSHSLASFRSNPVFVAFLHRVISANAFEAPALMAAAKGMQSGYLYVIDWRTPTPDGAVPPEDIIGAVQVSVGQLVSGSYSPNPNYVVLTADGLTRLTPAQFASFKIALPRRSGSDTK